MFDRRDGQMNHPAATNAHSQTSPLSVGRLAMLAIALLTVVASGCSRLRLPAIDPTGSQLFTPPPGSAGEGCLCFGCTRGLGCLQCGDGHCTKPLFQFPTPAFVEPATPPPCPTPSAPPASVGAGASNEPCVPSATCNGSCQNGPPAVLFGDECKLKNNQSSPARQAGLHPTLAAKNRCPRWR